MRRSLILLALCGTLIPGCDASSSNTVGDSVSSGEAGTSPSPDGGGSSPPPDAGHGGDAPSTPPGADDAGQAATDSAVATPIMDASGASGEAGSPGDDASVPESPSTGPFPAVTDFTKDGPYTSTMVENTGPNSGYTVYRPEELAPGGAKNPIVAWMNGGATPPDLYLLLPRLATHGFVVVASNTLPGIGDEVALGKELVAAIDWAIAENQRDGSDFYQKLDETKVAATGYSMGSLATFTMAADPRLTTTLHISGGNMDPERIKNLHAPAAFICGIPGDSSCSILDTDCDIAAANCDTDFSDATTPVFYANFPGGHLGILTSPTDAAIAAMATAWLRYQLMSDTTLKSMFVGPSCTYCMDSNWKVQQKNLQ